jgi:hypothetical protein
MTQENLLMKVLSMLLEDGMPVFAKPVQKVFELLETNHNVSEDTAMNIWPLHIREQIIETDITYNLPLELAQALVAYKGQYLNSYLKGLALVRINIAEDEPNEDDLFELDDEFEEKKENI